MTNHDARTGADPSTLLVKRALTELADVKIPPQSMKLNARVLYAKAQIVRRAKAERAVLAPITFGVPGAIAAGALSAAVALTELSVVTDAGAAASHVALVLLLATSALACTALAAGLKTIRKEEMVAR